MSLGERQLISIEGSLLSTSALSRGDRRLQPDDSAQALRLQSRLTHSKLFKALPSGSSAPNVVSVPIAFHDTDSEPPT